LCCQLLTDKNTSKKMTKQILRAEFKQAIKDKPILCASIAEANGKMNSTVETWLRIDDDRLTTATTLAIIRKHLGLDNNVDMTEPKELVEEESEVKESQS
jgi:hypothetical protein